MNAIRWKRLSAVRTLVHQAEERKMLQAQAFANDCTRSVQQLANRRAIAMYQSTLSLASGDASECSMLRIESDHLGAWQGQAVQTAQRAHRIVQLQREKEQQARLERKQMEQVLEKRASEEHMELERAEQAMADESFLMLRSAEARAQRRQNSLA